MKDNNNPIGVFDSGVGGLTILTELKALLPKETFIYLADQAFVPYGKKSKKQVQERVEKIAQFLLKKRVKMIVIACNTATIAGVDMLRKKTSVPVVGVVPVIKTATERTKTGKVAVFSTPATSKSRFLKDLIQNYAKKITVYNNGTSGLEELIEAGQISSPNINYTLINELKPLTEKGVDVIALGCTHYPFLREKMQKVVGKKVQIIDSGGAVARRVQTILILENLLAVKKGKDVYYTTKDAKKFQKVVQVLLHKRIAAKNVIL